MGRKVGEEGRGGRMGRKDGEEGRGGRMGRKGATSRALGNVYSEVQV